MHAVLEPRFSGIVNNETLHLLMGQLATGCRFGKVGIARKIAKFQKLLFHICGLKQKHVNIFLFLKKEKLF